MFIICIASSLYIIHEAQENIPQFYKNMILSAEYFPFFSIWLQENEREAERGRVGEKVVCKPK